MKLNGTSMKKSECRQMRICGRRTTALTQVLNRDTGILLGYEIACNYRHEIII